MIWVWFGSLLYHVWHRFGIDSICFSGVCCILCGRVPKGPNTIHNDTFTHYPKRPLRASRHSRSILLRRSSVRETQRHGILTSFLSWPPQALPGILASCRSIACQRCQGGQLGSYIYLCTYRRSCGRLGIRNLSKLLNSCTCQGLENCLASVSPLRSGRTPGNLCNTRKRGSVW
jgi:hypothetical protein